jgi:hypothetical protein
VFSGLARHLGGGVAPARWLLFVMLAFGSPAYATDVVPSVDDFNTKALASIAVVELLAIAWLARALLAQFEKRLEEQDRAHVRAQETHANVVKLGLQTTEAVAVLGEAVELVTRREP